MRNILLATLLMLTGCTIVGPGERGVRISLGTVSEESKAPGAYLWIPFILGMAGIDVQIQKAEIESTAATKDMQDVRAHIAVNWALDPKVIVQTYKSIGDERAVLQRILEPAVNEVMKSSTARRTAEEVLTKRMEMKEDIDNGLKERLLQYGIILHDVNIVNLSFSRDFSEAIEKKQIAEQEAKQAEYVALKATQEAKAEIERAKGQSEAQRLLKLTITPEILQQHAIEKWDGKFPHVMGTQTLPLLNLNVK